MTGSRSFLSNLLNAVVGFATAIGAAGLLCLTLTLRGQIQNPQSKIQNPNGLAPILSYIATGWNSLTRSMTECKMLADPKDPANAVLYFPAEDPIPTSLEHALAGCPVRLEHLPSVIHRLGQIDERKINPHGLLYLPYPYVVPGGMFNEMYGWDSYFILRGLLDAGKIDLARGIVKNFFFEIDHYGAVLNANRGYMLGRSQPPFLTAMVRAVYKEEKSGGRDDRAWLREAYPYGVKEYDFWNRTPNLAGSTGLSRYYALGSGPVPELGASSDAYYRSIAAYFLAHPAEAAPYLEMFQHKQRPSDVVGPVFHALLCDPAHASRYGTASSSKCDDAGEASLSASFYEGDRSLRESGFDICFKFGPFGAGTPDYAPVGLNSLLYNEAENLAWMSEDLGENSQASEWRARAERRKAGINRYFWNPQRGLFFDYNFKTAKQSDYVFATTFYPLWVGSATTSQAESVEKNLKLLERPGGIVTSTTQSGGQWDYPYGWAPLQLIAVEGLRRYGYNNDANRVSAEFLSMVRNNFSRDHTIREKYNVVTRSSELRIKVGYSENVIGFGWTNGVFTPLLGELPAPWRHRLDE